MPRHSGASLPSQSQAVVPLLALNRRRAFESHAKLRSIEQLETPIDHPMDVTRVRPIGQEGAAPASIPTNASVHDVMCIKLAYDDLWLSTACAFATVICQPNPVGTGEEPVRSSTASLRGPAVARRTVVYTPFMD
jgi:hypothetical protein